MQEQQELSLSDKSTAVAWLENELLASQQTIQSLRAQAMATVQAAEVQRAQVPVEPGVSF